MEIFSKNDHIHNHIITASQKALCENVAYHGHNFFELEWIVDGSGIYEIDGVEYEIKKNTLFLMSPTNIHCLKNANATLINVMFSHEYSKENPDITPHIINSPHFTFDETDGTLLYSILSELVKVHETDTNYAMLLINCVMSKLYYQGKSDKKQDLSYVGKSIIYMLENFQKGITLEDISAHLGLSPAYFSDLFRKESGVNFKDYLDDIRFSYAQKLLLLTPLSIKEIHFKSGFRDYTNFVRRFKQKYKVTPTDYRKSRHLK